MSGLSAGCMIHMDWQSTAEGETILQNFYNPHSSGRKLFGLLEKPTIPMNIEEVSYKLFFVGKSGIGKSLTIARFAGINSPPSYLETAGIQKTNILWPVKIWEKIILFKLQCWDVGENSLKKYSHILPSCKNRADGIVFVFSFMDRSSFNDLIPNINKMTKDDPSHPAITIIGSRYNPAMNMEVTLAETRELELKYRIPVLKMNVVSPGERHEVSKVAPLLNIMCEQLWMRDQEYLLKQGLSS
ncbi:hypothetical protein M8J75_014590 [Diaphorina citri]|nr:hypothetical protein M8J75_014590 [Diaphorina citri]KAI5755181.1 hypothetical protein M8J77_014758 [Diaphorina citri]